MGPGLICDKSTLQSLAQDELNTLRKYHTLIVPPVLVMEILGDLKKETQPGSGQREVRILSGKILPASSTVHTNFRTLVSGETLGHRFPMDGRPVIGAGKQLVSPEGKRGVLIEEPPESKAMLRWQVGDFNSAEELFAEAWRTSTKSIDLEAMQRSLRAAYSPRLKLRTLKETVDSVDDLMASAPWQTLLHWFLVDAAIQDLSVKVLRPPTNQTANHVPFYRLLHSGIANLSLRIGIRAHFHASHQSDRLRVLVLSTLL